MRVAVVGPGKIGGTIAASLARAGHEVVICGSRRPEALADEALRLGVAGAGSLRDCVDRSDVVVLSLPFFCVHEIPRDAFDSRIVIDAMNFWVHRDGAAAASATGLTSSESVQARFPKAKVVKALNTLKWDALGHLARRRGHPDRLVIPISGDCLASMCIAARVVDDVGFDPLVVGSLRSGGVLQQPGGSLHGAQLHLSDLCSTRATSLTVRL